MTEIVVYDAANSPAGRRVRMTLLEKGMGFEIRWLNLGLMDQKQDWYLRLNPAGMVPTLMDGERVVFDSIAIIEYLDETRAEPRLVPADAPGRAEMRMWFAFELECAKPFRDSIYETIAKDRLAKSGLTWEEAVREIRERTKNPFYAKFARQLMTTPRDEELLADRRLVLFERLAWMEDRLADGRRWLLGDVFSLADIALAPRHAMYPLIGVEVSTIAIRASPAGWLGWPRGQAGRPR